MLASPCHQSRWGFAALLAGLTACGQWQRVGSSTAPDPGVIVPKLFDPTALYRGMGFFARGSPLPFVATVRFLAGPGADSTLAIFGLSLASNALSFQRAGQGFEAQYRVEAAFRREGDIVGQIASDETVRVATFQETLRADESVIFQQVVRLPPGRLAASVLVRDRRGSAFNQDDRDVIVPRFGPGPLLSSPLLIYEGKARTERAMPPGILVNPRATAPYGADSLDLYLEGYGLAPGTVAELRALDSDNTALWHGSAAFTTGGPLNAVVVRLSPADLPVGELRIEAMLVGGTDTLREPILVSFSDQWAIANFDEVLSLLRFFGQDQAIRHMKDAAPRDRPALWHAFWKATDPNPATPENESLVEYFRRLQTANTRFQEGNDPGWLTDRGEVYVTLGEPDEIYDQSSDLQGQRRFIRWTYVTQRLQLDFLDDSGFGRFRLTPASRSDYQRVLNRVRRNG